MRSASISLIAVDLSPRQLARGVERVPRSQNGEAEPPNARLVPLRAFSQQGDEPMNVAASRHRGVEQAHRGRLHYLAVGTPAAKREGFAREWRRRKVGLDDLLDGVEEGQRRHADPGEQDLPLALEQPMVGRSLSAWRSGQMMTLDDVIG